MNHASLFTGIGGFDLAAEWMGWENVFHCEWNPFGQKVLKHYWPNAISYNDITKTDFTIHRGQIDILTGGFPCQPASTAGKRKGTDDDRWLWPEMLRAIREIQPSFVVAENVRGLLSLEGGLVFDTVLADLEGEGYEVLPFLLPACAVNAPHRRDRIWIVAKNTRSDGRRNGEHEERGSVGDKRESSTGGQERDITQEIVAHSTNDSRINGNRHDGETRPQTIQGGRLDEFGSTSDTERIGQQGQRGAEQSGGTKTDRNWKASWSYDDGRWPTQSPLCERNDGLPDRLVGITVSKHRKESIKAFGNAIVPQIAFEIFKAIENGRL